MGFLIEWLKNFGLLAGAFCIVGILGYMVVLVDGFMEYLEDRYSIDKVISVTVLLIWIISFVMTVT